MKLRKNLVLALLATGLLAWHPGAARALSAAGAVAMNPAGESAASDGDFIESREFQATHLKATGTASAQTVTAFQVIRGTWNGQILDGLSLVLTQTHSANDRSPPTFSCYVSHLASAAQRNALLNAFVSTLGKTADISTWRIEPAVIIFDATSGGMVIVHLGAIA